MNADERALQTLLAEGKLAEAETLLASLAAERQAGAREEALIQRGMLQVRLGQLDAALATLRRLPHHPHAKLHLAHALRFMGKLDEAEVHYRSALRAAERDRDGPLAMASLCGLGEASLERRLGKKAAEHFGRALGISEWLADERLTVLPLAGLAQAHALWGNPHKAKALVERALLRAHEPLGTARAQLALGTIGRELAPFERGLAVLERAPHEPLRVQLLLAKQTLAPTTALRDELSGLAQRYGMQGVLRALQEDA